MKKIVFIAVTDQAIKKALVLQKQFPKSLLITTRENNYDTVSSVNSISEYLEQYFSQLDGIVFISAMGICVRMIAPFLEGKELDPAVICMDEQTYFVQSVIGGHKKGANALAEKVAAIFGSQAVLSTASDVQQIWALDLLAEQFDWTVACTSSMTALMALFVNRKPTALLLEIKDKGTAYLEQSLPDFVTVFYKETAIDYAKFELLICVSPRLIKATIPCLAFYPKVLTLGTGCSKALDSEQFKTTLLESIKAKGYSPAALKCFGSVDIKAKQQAYVDFSEECDLPFQTFTREVIQTIEVPNPSKVVQAKIGVDGVSESTAMLLANQTSLLVEKQKVLLENGEKFTFALALDRMAERKAVVAIIGAGPGDELLITVKGKNYLEQADCVLYAGSLVPEEMTNWCKAGAVVMNSAMMTLEEQITLMQKHYEKGHLIVRLQSGDPSLYGAIQEQMSIFDDLGMHYFIIPGISSFSAAAAALKSEFTIPEVVQSVILTRGAGKTPLPEAEKLEEMAKHKATMCIFLSATLVKKVEAQLLEHYDPETPVAVLYRVTWKDEEIYQGTLQNLAAIVKKSKKTRTVLFIIGACIGARKNRSQLYNPDWKHIFRTNKKFTLKE
ncbi:precorrin-4 C(11)-methyltransferase [Aureispira anguillae]|uniref:Precorrin-4 C(11)-methyltransferase n=1 Tax=Aureispira anguillae TaxID=2864201 RepID=A0A916DT34_9BACT|nr:precorrin-4 C(11)-methyltransferase [Aureispira anguillae]BDS11201.1 precorrin-4 C(11)-methyltransferase [Aureispira anguillae]